MIRSIFKAAVLVWLTIVAPATVEAEESRAALAPPGRCAEPRTAAGSAGAGDDFAVTGPVSSLFDPLDVAAAPMGNDLRRPEAPDPRALVRPGSCDQPGSGCGATLSTRSAPPPVVVVPPVTPGVRPPRAPH